MRPDAILETCLYVDDLEQARRFYTEVLGLELHSAEPGRHAFFYCGKQMLLLFCPRQSSDPAGEIPPHGATGPGHLAFSATEEELAAWREKLLAAGVKIETIFNWPQGGKSIYFRDPAGNSLEFATPRIWGSRM